MVEYHEYSNVIIKLLNSCVKEPQQYASPDSLNPRRFLAVFIMDRNGTAKLDFIQNIEYKFIELLSADFMASDEEAVR